MNILQYKGYKGSVEYSAEDGCLIGKILYTKKANIGYAGDSVEEIIAMFHQAVDEYLQLCEEQGWQPETSNEIEETDDTEERIDITLPRRILARIDSNAQAMGETRSDYIARLCVAG